MRWGCHREGKFAVPDGHGGLIESGSERSELNDLTDEKNFFIISLLR